MVIFMDMVSLSPCERRKRVVFHRWTDPPGGGGGEGGEPHGTSRVVAQGVGHEGLPPLAHLYVCWGNKAGGAERSVTPRARKEGLMLRYVIITHGICIL